MLWIVALAAVAGLVWLGYRKGLFAPAAPGPTKAPPAGPFGGNLSAGEYNANDPAGGQLNLHGGAAQAGCLIYTKGQGGDACRLVGQLGHVVGNTRIGKEATYAVATGGLYHPVKYGYQGAKKITNAVRSWF